MPVRWQPEGYHTLTPYLIVRGAAKAIAFYEKAFGAREILRLDGPEGCIMHAELRIGDSVVMLADEAPEMNIRGPASSGGAGVTLLVYDEDVDGRFATALAAGAKQVRPVTDQFYGDRNGTVEDPFGHVWTIATHTEDVDLDEVKRRYASRG